MVRHKSAIRQHRRSLRRNLVNKKNKTAVKTKVKELRSLIKESNKEEAQAQLPRVFSAIDKTVKKRAIEKNTGARLKSRLSRQVGLITPAQPK